MGFARARRRVQGVQFSSDAVARAGNASQPVFPRSKSMFYKTSRFRRADRILSSRDFRHVIEAGKRVTSGSFVVVIGPRRKDVDEKPEENRRRLGITVSKRVGNAAIRNRVKRCIREWFRHAREGLPEGSDIVVIARRAVWDLSGCEVTMVLEQMVPAERARGAS